MTFLIACNGRRLEGCYYKAAGRDFPICQILLEICVHMWAIPLAVSALQPHLVYLVAGDQ